MNQPPAFQFYADDFLGGTIDLTTEEVGAYIRLLCFQWNRGSVPVQADKLKLIAGCDVTEAVKLKFPHGKNERLEQERQKQADYREKQRQKGILSGQARFNRGSTVVQPSGEPKGNSPSPSPFIPSMGDCRKWLADWKKSGADYTEAELQSAFLALSANGWMWGKNPVVDFRAALERQIQTDRSKKPYEKNTNNGAGRVDRSLGTSNEGKASNYRGIKSAGMGGVVKVADAP